MYRNKSMAEFVTTIKDLNTNTTIYYFHKH